VRLEGRGEMLTIFVGESDQHSHRPLYTEIVERARRAGLAGATVIRGVEGFGASARLHKVHALQLSEDAPVAVIVVDDPARIEAFLPVVEDLVGDGLVVREGLDVIVYRGRSK
jgi:PII-like signaling protein